MYVINIATVGNYLIMKSLYIIVESVTWGIALEMKVLISNRKTPAPRLFLHHILMIPM